MQSRLYDLKNDPEQLHEIHDEAVETHMKKVIEQFLEKLDAPKELYSRYGISHNTSAE